MDALAEGPAGAWQPVCDEVIAGLHHALNNRVGTLLAVTQILEGEMAIGHPLRQALSDEMARLQETVATLTLLPRGPSTDREPIQLGALLESVLTLYGYHHGVRDTPCRVEEAADVLPVCAEPALLARVLLALLIAAGQAARRVQGWVRVTYGGDPQTVEVLIEAVEASEGIGGDDARAIAEDDRRAIDAAAFEPWVREMGGALSVEGPAGKALAILLQLGTLPEIRRRERLGLL